MKFDDVSDKVPGSAVPVKRKQPPGGSRKGIPNKVTKELKDMILGALDDAGGQSYLQVQAHENPTAFLSLVGKVLPTTIKAAVEGGITVQVTTGVPQSPEDASK